MGWERYFFQFLYFFFLISTEYIHVSYLILLEFFFSYINLHFFFSVWFAKQRLPLPRNAETPALKDKKKINKINKIKQNELIKEYQGFNFTHFFLSRGVQERSIWFKN